ncbi:S8 family serine peptidase [Streptomyces sp. CB01881]|uniref:S8 family peptidase n=1 Tax=Streptomyces sp. CB01881 TaxID=2078691 RepID=UPI000CDC9546|nr:S8 family serine peptidase [Streptomyces sp. CB01881]AUY49335.1 peptidase S8 [Streptomyces sp. CB01881]TYC72723.1 peptidase S8 [Streptomyces sp. CB01881]
MSVPRISRTRYAAVGVVLATAGALALPAGTAVAATGAEPTTGPLLSYVVNTQANHGQVQKVEKAITTLGGSVVYSYEQIGVVIARSNDTKFAAKLRQAKGVQSVGASRTKGITAADTQKAEAAPAPTAAAAAAAAAAGQEPNWANQWDMRQIGVDKAHKISLGSRNVTVGVLDSGIDATHEDLAANVDASQSVSCIDGGKPNTDWKAWQPGVDGDHGTHVAGTIAAAKNGKGIEGIAPNVKLAAVRVVDDNQFIYPEYAICGFVWAGEHKFNVTNNSYYVDPWMFNCQNDADQAAITTAVRRAVEFSQRKGVLNVAAAGNENIDLAHKTTDVTSPDDTTPGTRPVTTDCLSLPTELDGVVVASSVGVNGDKAYYSSYGKGKVTVAAPGGDRRYQIPDTPDKNGRTLSTIPGGGYGYMQGTSMASPHVAGVLALLASTHPWASPEELTELLTNQAESHACPSAPFNPGGAGEWKATCEGGENDNGFYGAGIINAEKAVQWWR